jgi:hypothetical protein
MPFLEIRTSTLGNIVIIILGVLFAGFLLLMGIGNLVYPDVPEEHIPLNTAMCLTVCCLSLLPLLLAIAAFRGILFKRRSEGKDETTAPN